MNKEKLIKYHEKVEECNGRLEINLEFCEKNKISNCELFEGEIKGELREYGKSIGMDEEDLNDYDALHWCMKKDSKYKLEDLTERECELIIATYKFMIETF